MVVMLCTGWIASIESTPGLLYNAFNWNRVVGWSMEEGQESVKMDYEERSAS